MGLLTQFGELHIAKIIFFTYRTLASDWFKPLQKTKKASFHQKMKKPIFFFPKLNKTG